MDNENVTKTFQQLPPLPQPTTGRWVWKEETKCLDFVSLQSNDRGLRRRGLGQKQASNLNTDATLKTLKNTTSGFANYGVGSDNKSPSKNAKKQEEAENENAKVSLQDVKNVAVSMMSKVESIPQRFTHVFHSKQTDVLLYALIRYFRWVFEKLAADSKPNPMNIEPSLREIEDYQRIQENIKAHESVVGNAYCGIVLGKDLESEHHMLCGDSKVSSTRFDRELFETIYSFCVYTIWIAFKRKDFRIVQKDLGRILRSDTFNPAIRVKNFSPSYDKDGKLIAEEKVTLAEYRRIHPKRPAIQSVVSQRSPAVVSVFPSPKEKASYLFDRRKGIGSDGGKKEVNNIVNDESELPEKVKLCILGDPLTMYTAQLVPKGADNEDEDVEDGEEGGGNQSEHKEETEVPEEAQENES